MEPTCRRCLYYCKEPFHEGFYDFTRSFCGLHGMEHIDNPDVTPPDLMHKDNSEYACRCGFAPIKEPIQLKLAI